MANFKLLTYTSTHSFVSVSLIIGSFLVYFLCLVIFSSFYFYRIFYDNTILGETSDFYLIVFHVVLTGVLMDLGITEIFFYFSFIKKTNKIEFKTTKRFSSKLMVTASQVKRWETEEKKK